MVVIRTTAFGIVLNAAYSIGRTVITILIAFWLTPFVVSHLGMETYGIWMTIGAVFAYSHVVQVGLSSSVVRFTSLAISLNDEDYGGTMRPVLAQT